MAWVQEKGIFCYVVWVSKLCESCGRCRKYRPQSNAICSCRKLFQKKRYIWMLTIWGRSRIINEAANDVGKTSQRSQINVTDECSFKLIGRVLRQCLLLKSHKLHQLVSHLVLLTDWLMSHLQEGSSDFTSYKGGALAHILSKTEELLITDCLSDGCDLAPKKMTLSIPDHPGHRTYSQVTSACEAMWRMNFVPKLP